MKVLKFLGIAIMATIVNISFMACNDDDEDKGSSNPIVGTWQEDEDNGNYFVWKFNADGTGIEQEYYNGQLEEPATFTYTYDTKTTVLTITYKEEGDLIAEDIDTYYVTINGNTMKVREFWDGGEDETPDIYTKK